ncbi:CAP domain-containing protein [Streptomyces catenulae]|uniref:CAP domain-containing protein n=1 Tax=Streptomyces catenulae TaxID=66875 RepID=A0ABV2YVH4_9ACTN|nr:CAP domain-containing protein [Streptomyces catenulae]
MPVRTGLIGASAAVAMGTVAVASGLFPGGGDRYVMGEEAGQPVRANSLPDASPQGGESATPTDRASGGVTRGSTRGTVTGTDRPTSAASPSTSPSPKKHHRPASPEAGSGHGGGSSPSTAPKTTTRPQRSVDSGTSAEAQVLSLVNDERAKAGCSPVKADAQLASLATAFSDDMAARGFFDHTDPDGKGPWDRARVAGISDLGGENIARGQADAKAVMEAWMNSPGHRANILNCEYRTLGVGIHRGPGGPWWTQDFGF